MGGLGNQMFQYAAGYTLAQKKNAALVCDMDYFQEPKAWPYSLDLFGITVEEASPEDKKPRTEPKIGRKAKLLSTVLPQYKNLWYREPHFHVDPNFFHLQPPVYVDGYWQSEQYFLDQEADIREIFRFKDPIHASLEATQAKIQDPGRVAVSLHVRRGDYVAVAKNVKYHGTCTPEYYAQAEKWLMEQLPEFTLFVFSDDIAWAQENLTLQSAAEFVDSSAAPDYEDMRLMSYCDHHIIANSSFSWWGAWLNGKAGKKVVAPLRWFDEAPHDTKDLVPATWHRL